MTKRKILTAAVILGAVVLIGLILFLSLRKREGLFTGGEDTPYPYAWTEEKDGTVLVMPGGKIPAGFRWAVAELDESVAAAA